MQYSLSQDLDHILTHTEELWVSSRGERFFLTGGTGFVGSWLVESLLWANKRLNLKISATLLTRDRERFCARHPHLAGDPALNLYRGDCTAFDYPAGSFPFIVHAASGRYAASTQEQPASAFSTDVAAIEHMLEFAHLRQTKRFLFTSSGAVYGKQPPQLTHVPEDYVGAPLPTDSDAAYAHAKRTAEFLCCCYSRSYRFDVMIARLFAFTGPYLPLDENFAVGNFIADVLAGGPVRITGNGKPYRAYLYAADLAIWLWTILFRGKPAFPYNVGSPDELTIAELARVVVAHSVPGTEIHIAGKPKPGAPSERYVPSITQAAEDLGLKVWIPLEEGIRRMWLWNQARIASQAAHKEHRIADFVGKARIA